MDKKTIFDWKSLLPPGGVGVTLTNWTPLLAMFRWNRNSSLGGVPFLESFYSYFHFTCHTICYQHCKIARQYCYQNCSTILLPTLQSCSAILLLKL
jgi:hypothetical protein